MHQVARPKGRAAASDFAFREEDLSAPAPAHGLFLVTVGYPRECYAE